MMENVVTSNTTHSQYETLIVSLVTGRKTNLVRALLESQRLCITSSCAKEMGFSQVNEESNKQHLIYTWYPYKVLNLKRIY